ncbi:MAG: P1 family peptidase [Bryobacterales bacterium]|nr:P1 family peptidase [Bryobacterales bacterium]MBV9397099.1 P1 family peptidase [Bryobacterales bacterium]
MKGLTDIPGILVGHASDYDGLTGCTAILCEAGAVGGGDIRGSATGTQEWDLLHPQHLTERIHGVVFSGGSAFGLEAASGVRRFLEHSGIGYETGAAKVPLVPAAILYDLGIGKATARPTRESGEAAAAAATNRAVVEGAVGAGTGATVGKLLGMRQAMKSGIGSWTVELEGKYKGVLVAALAAVNAVGDVRDPATNKIVAGARTAPNSMDFADSARIMKGGTPSGFSRTNTSLVVVATNALLTKVQATKLAQFASLGVARAIHPVNTMSDGDVTVALSIGRETAPIDSLGIAAAEAVVESILRAVRLAPTLGGVPGLKA